MPRMRIVPLLNTRRFDDSAYAFDWTELDSIRWPEQPLATSLRWVHRDHL